MLDAAIDARLPLLIVFNKMGAPGAGERLAAVKKQLGALRGLHFSPGMRNAWSGGMVKDWGAGDAVESRYAK